jgi:hypothetical protein
MLWVWRSAPSPVANLLPLTRRLNMIAWEKWRRGAILVCVLAAPLGGWLLTKGVSFGITCNKQEYQGMRSFCSSAYPQGSFCFDYPQGTCGSTQAGYGGGIPMWYKACSAPGSNPAAHCVIKTENCTPKCQCWWSEGMGLCMPGTQVDSLWLTADGAFAESCTPSG